MRYYAFLEVAKVRTWTENFADHNSFVRCNTHQRCSTAIQSKFDCFLEHYLL